MKRHLIFLCLTIVVTGAYAQSVKITGNIIESAKQILTAKTGASISLLQEDSTLVSETISNSKGVFLFSGIKPGNYFLNISFVGYQSEKIMLKNLVADIDLGNIELKQALAELNEVKVSSNTIIQKIDRMVVLPTQSALKNAYDSYELLNNLNIPRLLVNPLNKAIEANGKAVQTRINGIVATTTEVSAILAKDVLRVDVIEYPGERYGDPNLGAVVDIIVRKPKNGGSVNILTTNSPVVLFGENNLSAKYNQGKSQWSVNYFLEDKRFLKARKDVTETYYLENETIRRVQEGINDSVKYLNHKMNISYNLSDPDKYTFNVIFRNAIDNAPFTNQSSKLYGDDSKEPVFSKKKTKSISYSPSLDIYYQKNLPNKQSIQIDVIGTLINTEMHRNYREFTKAGNDLSLLQMDVDGKKYSIIGEVIYDKTIDKVKLSAGLRHSQMYTENIYSGTNPVTSDMNQAQSSAFFELQGKIKKISYLGSMGIMRTYFKEGNEEHTYYNFTPTVRLSYVPHKNGSINYRFNSSPRTPSLSSLTDVEQALDTIQIVRGNPDLTTYYVYNNTLDYSYTYKKMSATFSTGYAYYDKKIMESVFAEGDKLIIMDENQRSFQELKLATSLGLNGINVGKLKNFLTLTLRGGYIKYWSYGNRYSHVYDNFFYDANAVLKYKKLAFMAQYAKRLNTLEGETVFKGENITAFMLTYNLKRLQVGAGILFPFTNNYRTGSDRLSSVAPVTSWIYIKEAGQLFSIRLNYNLEFGKKYQTGQKKINNSDTDAGVISTKR